MIRTIKRRPSSAFKQRYGHLMLGLPQSLGLETNEQEAPVPALTPPTETPIIIPYAGIALTGGVDAEQVGRDHIIHLKDGTGIRLNNLSGKDGLDGISVASVDINRPSGDLIIGLTNETVTNLGRIVGTDGKDGVGVRTLQVSNKNLIVGLTNDTIVNAGRIVGENGDPGKRGLSIRGKQGLRGKRGYTGKGKKGDPGKDAEPAKIPAPVVVNQEIPDVGINFDLQRRRLQIKVGEKSSNWVVIPGGGGGGGLAQVTSDASLSGLGTTASPLSVVGGEATVDTDDSLSGDGHPDTPLSVVDSEIDHRQVAYRGTNTHAQIDTHLGSVANPHSVTAAQAAADPAGSAAAVAALLTTHEVDTTNPHVVTAAQAGADPAGSAAAVAGDLATHEGVSDIHVAHSGVTLSAGVGLTGGGDITANRTFTLEDTAVTPGAYTRASITIDQQGRITAASSGSAPAVDSVFGRTGAVVAATDDYTWAQIDKTTSDLADLTTKAHVSTTGKQGGTTAEYYHLTSAQHVIATQAAGAALSGYMTAAAQTFGGVKTFNNRVNSPSHSILTRHIQCEVFTDAGINACMAELGASGGEVYLPKATYVITGPITIPVANITLQGAGKGTILDASGGQAFHVITGAARDNTVIRDLQIIGKTGEAGDNYLIYLNNCDKSEISGCLLQDADSSVIAMASSEDMVVCNNFIVGGGGHGIWMNDTGRMVAERNIITGVGGIGIYATNSAASRCKICNNIISDTTGQGIRAYQCDNIDIQGNQVYSPVSHGIELDDALNCRIIDNTVFEPTASSKADIYCWNGSSSAIIMGNHCLSSAGKSDWGIYLSNAPNSIVIGNYSEGHDLAGIRFAVASTGCTVGGNTLLDTVPILDATTNHTFAIHSSLTLPETTTPTPLADYAKLYAKADDKAYWQDGAGAEHELAYAGAAPTAHAPSHTDATDQIADAVAGKAAKTVTAVGSAQVDTDVVDPWGTYTGTALLDGNSDSLQVGDHADFPSGTDSWTIDLKARLAALPANGTQHVFYSQWVDGTHFIWFYIHNAAGTYQLACHIYNGGEVVLLSDNDITVAVDTWYEFSVERSGSDWKLYQDGVVLDTDSNANSMADLAVDVYIGAGNSQYFDGHLAEIRVSSVARHAGAYPPSTGPYVTDANTILLVRGTGADESTTFIDASGSALAGFLTGADKAKLDGIAALADVTGDNAPQAHAPSHKTAGGDPIKLDEFATPDDNATLNSTTSEHGLLKKLDNVATNFMDGQGNWSVPAGSSGDVSAGANLTADMIVRGDDGAKGVKTSLTKITDAGDVVVPDNQGVHTGTSDGSDNKSLFISGGGGISNTRGAYIALYGNEDAGVGVMDISAGNVTGGHLYLSTGGVARITVSDAGLISLVGGGTRIGDGGVTNYLSISPTGDTHYVGSAGMPYGELWVLGNAVETAIGGAGTFVQFTGFTNDGSSNNTTPVHAQDHIEIDIAGDYECLGSFHVESIGAGAADIVSIEVRKNGGTVVFSNLHAHRKLAGGGDDIGSISISGILPNLAVNDTIEVWLTNDNNATNILVADANLTILQIGGAG